MYLKPSLLILTSAFLLLTLVNPIYPREQALQHVPTAFVVLALAIDCRRNWLTTPAFVCTILFFLVHILGARYIYSAVPYDELFSSLFGTSTRELFGFHRNHFDRLVHFLFGGLFLVASSSMIERYLISSRLQNLFLSFCVVTAMSGVYEVFEWWLTIVMSPHDADSYNGQQGDMWDAQKDIGLAMLGSVLTMPFMARKFPVKATIKGTTDWIK
ncbi:MAG: DUF2238 domain-containing protein [Pirellulales bacterium]